MSKGELIFTHIFSSKFGIKKQSINFSNNFKVTYLSDKLTIEKNKNEDKFFGEFVTNISLIIGKNGAGKSSILQLITLDKNHRKKYLPNTVFFNIYHVKDNIYYFEGSLSLAKKVLNDREINKEEFFFKIEKEQIIHMTEEKKYPPFITTVYQTLFPNISWSEKKKLNSSKAGFINKKYTNAIRIDKVINFMSTYLNHNSEFNAEFIFKQKQKYNSKPGELMFLYQAESDSHNLSLLSDYSVGYQQFLEEFSFKTNDFQEHSASVYIRENQDKIYSENVKEYFILRMLEKIYLSSLNNLEWSTNDENYKPSKREILKEILERKTIFGIGSLNGDLDELKYKIKYLISILDDFFDLGQTDSKLPLRELIEYIMQLPHERFENSNQFVLSIDSFTTYEHELTSVIVEYFSNIIDIKARHLSDGQYVYCSTFTQIFEAVNEYTDHNLLLVLDEPDINMHPEWSRCFIDNILSLIPSFTNRKVQLIISTHSPFLVSDVPNSNVYQIVGEGNNKKINTVDKSFAANIFDIISGGFYLEYPIGEFARKKIESIKSKESNIIDLIDDPFLAYVLTRGDV